jgi:hypothetical protein
MRNAMMPAQLPNRSSSSARQAASASAFTIAELCIGLIITAMVLSALASFMLATGKAWSDSGSDRQAAIVGWQGAQRLVQIVEQAGLVPSVQPGSLTSLSASPAGVILWKSDTNGDGQIEFSELEVISADPDGDGTWTLNLYTPSLSSGAQDEVWDYSVLTDPSSISLLKPLMTATPLVRGLSGVHIDMQSSATQRQLVEFALAMPVANGPQQIVYISAACQAPLTAPND